MTDTIRVTATGRAPGYMPEFVARELGFFADADLEVETIVPHDWEEVLPDIESGECDLALGGIWVPAMFRGRGKEFVVAGQLCHRASFSVVARQPLGEDWAHSLADRSVLVPGRGGASLNMFLEMYLKEQGAELGQSRVAHDLTSAMMNELYAGGGGEILMVEAVQARRLEALGNHIVGDFLNDGGDIPWSVYYTTPETLRAKESTLKRFNQALERAMGFMNGHPAEEYVPQVARWYPAFSEQELLHQAEAMQKAGMWTSTRFQESSYQRWQRGIVLGGLLEEPMPSGDLIADFALEG
ncbi:ABC transporter substrate-binding protein [Nesterenkonia populi]|uniref:ABC transporter substrate-binding protein n=1 Tax=Nesterenkonia populi TaxID=1591087 RepID=UPI0011BE9282|nr:ABC transporter substrate-binding protein [Nesterenkonia populi]